MTSESTRSKQAPAGESMDIDLEVLQDRVADQIFEAAIKLEEAWRTKKSDGTGVKIARDYALTIIGLVVRA